MAKHISAFVLFTVFILGLIPAPASASLILESYASGTATPTTIGGYGMTDFAISNTGNIGSTTTSVASPISGSLYFLDDSSDPLALTRNLADNVSWWNNGESNDYDIFTTDQHLVTLLLPANTFAFSFTVGANVGSTGDNAWLTATETDGQGISSLYRFNVNRDNTPSFGIYADNSNGTCSMLSSVTIEPDYWGAGNFSINQGECTTSVPEPPSLALLVWGLFGFSAARLYRKA